MPRIARFNSTSRVSSPRTPQAANLDPNAGQAAFAAAEGLEQIAGILEREEEADAVSYVSRTSADAQVFWAQRQAELQQGAGEGAPGYTQTVTSEWQQYREGLLAAAPNDTARDMLDQRLTSLGTSVQTSAVRFQHEAVMAQRSADFGLTTDRLAQAVRIGQMTRDEALREWQGNFDGATATWMSPEVASAYRAESGELFLDEAHQASYQSIRGELGLSPLVSASPVVERAALEVSGEFAPAGDVADLRPEIGQALALAGSIFGEPISVSSGHRTEAENRAVDGAPDSRHLHGLAVDIPIALDDPRRPELVAALIDAGFTSFGEYDGHIHADFGNAVREWQGASGTLPQFTPGVAAVLAERGVAEGVPAADIVRQPPVLPSDVTSGDTPVVSDPVAEVMARPDFQALPIEMQERLIRDVERDQRERRILARAELEPRIQTELAILATGDTAPEPVHFSDVAAAYEPEDVPRVWRQITAARATGELVAQVSDLSAAEQSALLTSLEPVPGTDFIAQQERHDAMAEAIRIDQEAREADPAGYVLRHSEALTGAVERAQQSGDVGQMAGAVAMIMDEQRRLGIVDPRPVPQPIAEAFIAQWGRTQGGARVDGLHGFIAGLGGSETVQAVMGQLADAGMPDAALVIASMDRPEQRGAAIALASIADMDLQDLMRPVSETRGDIDAAVQQGLQGFYASLDLNAGGADAMALYTEQTQRLAYRYVASGMSPRQAAQEAVAGVVGARYEFPEVRGRAIRVPIGENVEVARRGAEVLLLAPGMLGDIPAATSVPGVDPDELQRQFRNSLRANGFWVTLPDDSGLMLMVGTAAGPEMVLDANELPVSRTWAQLRDVRLDALDGTGAAP